VYGYNQFGDETPNVVIIPREFGTGQAAIDAFNQGAAYGVGYANTQGYPAELPKGELVSPDTLIGYINNRFGNHHLHISIYQLDSKGGFVIHNPVQFFPPSVQKQMVQNANKFHGGYSSGESPLSINSFHTTSGGDRPNYWLDGRDRAENSLQITRP
jgi:hypothetical protein